MKPEQIRIVIAEVCGLHLTSVPPTWYDQHSRIIPNYPEDLNACHKMEKVLLPEQTAKYENYLALAVYADDKDEYWTDGIKHIQAYCIHATSLQRCEAFIKTVCPERWAECKS